MVKFCKDGRIWGQNNKEAHNHLGILTGRLPKKRKYPHLKWNSKEINPNWKGGKSFELYTSLFNKQLKERVRVRDNFKCQICGIPELELIERLHAHHIDYNKKNCELNNLVSLCRSCHTKTNFNREKWETYFKQKGR